MNPNKEDAKLMRGWRFLLILVLCLALPFHAFATSPDDLIDDILADYYIQKNNAAENINHQIANGLYRSVELLAIIAYELDLTGIVGPVIQDVLKDFSEHDSAAENINHQIVNGAYRMVDLLANIAYQLDNTGNFGTAIESQLSDCIANDNAAENIKHQIVNGLYRSVELPAIIAYEIA